MLEEGLSKTDFEILFKSGKDDIYLQYYLVFLKRDVVDMMKRNFSRKGKQSTTNDRPRIGLLVRQ